MSDTRTTKDLSTQQENELICAQLLCWTPDDGGWIKEDGYMYGGCGTPRFDDWAEAGLILDALKAAGEKPRLFVRADELWGCMGWHCGGVGDTAFAAIRATALECIRSRR